MNILIESETRLKYNHMRLDFVVYGNDTILTVLFRYFFFFYKDRHHVLCNITIYNLIFIFIRNCKTI